MDEERWDYEGAKYGHAVEMICSFYGEFLPNDRWTGMQLAWAETVNDVLVDVGVPTETFSVLGHLIHRGPPIALPDIDDFPYIGYIAQAEIPDILNVLTDKRLKDIHHEDADSIRDSIKQIREWLETCLREKYDLVCFCY
jgi:hypothetical protein